MSRIDCGDADSSVPCRCDPVTGCGHLSAWHRVFERWTARCEVPGCACAVMDVCNCVAGMDDAADPDASVLRALGITLS